MKNEGIIFILKKSIDGVLGIWTLDCWWRVQTKPLDNGRLTLCEYYNFIGKYLFYLYDSYSNSLCKF